MRRTSGPPGMRYPLFAKATVRPASSAARVEPRPREPVIPFRTMAQVHAAATVLSSGPARILGSLTWPSGPPSVLAPRALAHCTADSAHWFVTNLTNTGGERRLGDGVDSVTIDD